MIGHQLRFNPIKVLSNQLDAGSIGSNLTLSNNNRTVTKTTAVGWVNVRTTASRKSGKYYLEFVTSSTLSDTMVGVCNLSGYSSAGYLGSFPVSFGLESTAGGVYGYVNGGPSLATAVGGSNFRTNGTVTGLAIDMDNGNLWIASNNSWIAGGSPSTLSGPNVTGLLTNTDTVAAISCYSINDSMSVNLKSTELTYSPPSGFTAWAG